MNTQLKQEIFYKLKDTNFPHESSLVANLLLDKGFCLWRGQDIVWNNEMSKYVTTYSPYYFYGTTLIKFNLNKYLTDNH